MHTDLVVLPHDVALVPGLGQDRVLEHLGHTSGREALEFRPDFRGSPDLLRAGLTYNTSVFFGLVSQNITP